MAATMEDDMEDRILTCTEQQNLFAPDSDDECNGDVEMANLTSKV